MPTLDNIDNIEEHYYEIDYDPNLDVFSGGGVSDVEDYLEPQVEVTENLTEPEEQKHIDDDVDFVDELEEETLDIKHILEGGDERRGMEVGGGGDEQTNELSVGMDMDDAIGHEMNNGNFLIFFAVLIFFSFLFFFFQTMPIRTAPTLNTCPASRPRRPPN